MQFTKIRHKDTDTELKWSVPNEADREARELKSSDEPKRDSFLAAFEHLVPIVQRANGLTDEQAESLTVHTVSISRDPHGKRRVVISGTMKAEAGSYAMSTPALREPSDLIDEGGPSMLLSTELERIDELCGEAKEYINGARKPREPRAKIGQAPAPSEDPFPEPAPEEEPELVGVH